MNTQTTPEKDSRIVLACVDQSPFADTVADYAIWSAKQLDAPLVFLHVIERHQDTVISRDHSGTMGMDERNHLLKLLSDEDELKNKNARELSRIFMNRLREKALAAGVTQVDTKQRIGSLIESVSEQQDDVRLFVVGRRGQHAKQSDKMLGGNLEVMVRAISRPILTVHEAFRKPTKALIAFDGKQASRKAVDMVAKSPMFRGFPVHVLMAGERTAEGQRALQWVKERLKEADINAIVSQVPGDTEEVIAQTVQDEQIDILLMGAYSHSPLRSFLFGSKTSELLGASEVATLLLRQ